MFITAGNCSKCFISKNKGVDWEAEIIEDYVNDRLTSFICVNDTLVASGLAGTIYLAKLPNNAIKESIVYFTV